MENENKCFFSISLENGITITGSNTKEVRDFLLDISLLCGDSIEMEKITDTNNKNWIKYIQKLKRYVNNAWDTIYGLEKKKNMQ